MKLMRARQSGKVNNVQEFVRADCGSCLCNALCLRWIGFRAAGAAAIGRALCRYAKQNVFGATFTAPKEWSMRMAPRIVVIAAPEGDTSVAIVDVGAASDAAAAAAQACLTSSPQRRPSRALGSPLPPRDGWDAT